MNERHKQILKLGIAVLVLIGILSWVGYRWFNPNTKVEYNDFTIDSTIAWLENADAGKFDVCKKDIVDKDGWFDWFQKDRSSLEKLKSRTLIQRQSIPGAPAGMKRYELKFDSKFIVMKRPKSKITEKVIVDSNGKDKITLLMADYWPSRSFYPSDMTLTEAEKQKITAIAAMTLKKMEARDVAFFQSLYMELAKLPDYFDWNSYSAREAKHPKWTLELFKILDHGNPTPLKFIGMKAYNPAGRTGFECCSVRYSFSAEAEKKKVDYMMSVFVDRDLYLDKSAEWKLYGLWFWKEEKEKK